MYQVYTILVGHLDFWIKNNNVNINRPNTLSTISPVGYMYIDTYTYIYLHELVTSLTE